MYYCFIGRVKKGLNEFFFAMEKVRVKKVVESRPFLFAQNSKKTTLKKILKILAVFS